MSYTLGTAAKSVGMSKATIHRAIKAGKISATRLDDGSFRIDPAELHRVFPPVGSGAAETGETGSVAGGVRQSETGSDTVETALAVANARLEAELAGLKEIIRVHREQVDDLRTERDRLLGQVEAAHRLLTHAQTTEPVVRKRWWSFR